jgi:hypothetical protein
VKSIVVAFLLLFFSSLVFVNYSCKKEYVPGNVPATPFNPFDTIHYPYHLVNATSIDSNSFVGIHAYILATKCANLGCHDGHFEPDFRTVQSAYSSLVYQPVTKNNLAGTFVYRVKPGDVTNSWLHERITTNDPVLGRMPLYDSMLTTKQINRISNWIQVGAPDIFGQVSTPTNTIPQTFGIVAMAQIGANWMRVDTIRGGNMFYPMLVTNSTNLQLWFGIYDDVQAPFQLTNLFIRFSTNPADFTSSTAYPLSIQSTPTYLSNVFVSNKPYYLSYTLNTSSLPNNQPVYFQISLQDANHTAPTLIPSVGNQPYILSYFSLIVAP